MIPELLNGHRVVFRNKESFLKKVSSFQNVGSSGTFVISDFDFTLSKFKINNQRGASCHKVLEDCGLLDPVYHHDAQAIQKKYYAYEVDPHLDEPTRIKYMIEWVVKAHELLIQHGLTKDLIKRAVDDALLRQRFTFREHSIDFLHLLKQQNIPILIFSAGIADILEEILSRSIPLPDRDIAVISNRCHFDGPNERLSGFDEPMIHVYNKRASFYLQHEFFHRSDLQDGKRNHLLLFGDSLGDIHMSEGLKIDPENILRIGFLNDSLERMEEYVNNFDVVILDDPSFQIPMDIINTICMNHPSVDLTS